MFCYQCEETANTIACTKRGICGKSDDVSNLQDLLVYSFKGLSYYLNKLRVYGITDEKADLMIIRGLFSTITNANFDREFFISRIDDAISYRNELRKIFLAEFEKRESKKFSETIPDSATFEIEGYDKKAASVGILATDDEDIRSLKWTLIYGLKGMSAYLYHAYVLNNKNDEFFKFIEDALIATDNEEFGINDYLPLVLKCGEYGIKVMELLDITNVNKYGNPEPTKINISVRDNPAILISGHDLADLEVLLKQTEGTGVDIYTHGEMLPANAYPFFKKYKHLVGNYGGSWWHQTKEFESFNGPVVLTTNCLVPPSATYKDRVYVTGIVGFPGLKSIPKKDGVKDFSEMIEHAKKCAPPTKIDEGFVHGGFAHGTILDNAEKIIELVKSGKIKKFFVMAGCDARHSDREYYTKFAKELPHDNIILTAGCAKYRYNKLDLGEIEGLPRVLDAGQCNDSYSLIKVAAALKDAFKLKDLNDLPIVFNISWYEQKAVLILLSLLHLNIKNITLGPKLPAFLSENVLNLIIANYSLRKNSIVEEDMPRMLGKEVKTEGVDNEVFFKISSGMYAVSAKDGEKENSFIANTVFQLTSNPPTIAVSVAKCNLSHDMIVNSKEFSVSILSKDTPTRIIGSLGFKSGRDEDKLRLLKTKKGVLNSPIVLNHAVAYMEAKLKESFDVGTHTLFIGEVVLSKKYNDEEVMTYDFYHDVKNGKSPEGCPTFIKSEKKQKEPIIRDMSKYECVPCGMIYDPELGDPDSGIEPGTMFADIPDDWKCPVCGVDKSNFVRMNE